MDTTAYAEHYAAELHAMNAELARQGRAEMRASAERTLHGVRNHTEEIS